MCNFHFFEPAINPSAMASQKFKHSGMKEPDDMNAKIREKTLFVGNLDRSATEYHLIKIFQQFGSIEKVVFMWHMSGELKGQPRGFAFVELKTAEDARNAQMKANGLELLGRKMHVKFAEEKVHKIFLISHICVFISCVLCPVTINFT